MTGPSPATTTGTAPGGWGNYIHYSTYCSTALGIFRPDTGLWAIRGLTRIFYGSASDHPVPADYDGDPADEFGIFRDGTGLWAVRGLTRAYYGTSGDIPATR